jgi:hypothetical protein
VWGGFGCSRVDLETELHYQGLRAERLDGDPDLWSLAGVCVKLRRCAS